MLWAIRFTRGTRIRSIASPSASARDSTLPVGGSGTVTTSTPASRSASSIPWK